MPILSIMVGYVLMVIGRYVRRTTNNLILKSALLNLEKIILSTVTALSQTFVDDLKQNRSTGKLTEEEAKLIKSKALASIQKQLGDQDKDILINHFGSLDELIDNMVEQKVMENKLRKGEI
jgi:hypothetical protein